jgi:hypothetical protein
VTGSLPTDGDINPAPVRKRRRAVGPPGAKPSTDEPRREVPEERQDDTERFLRDVPPHHGPV